MEWSLVIPSFIAGVLTILAPCTLPLVPGYIGFISGMSIRDLRNPKQGNGGRKKIFLNGLLFVFGFSLIFIGLGTLAAAVGLVLSPYRAIIGRIGGIFVILFGFFMIRPVMLPTFLPLYRDIRPHVTHLFKPGNPVGAFVFGATFGLGWTPCVGPILGTILLLASNAPTVTQGALLLFVFSLGLATPFLLMAFGIRYVLTTMRPFHKFLLVISVVGGIFVIFLGVLLLTNNYSAWIVFFYRLFGFIHFDELLNYL